METCCELCGKPTSEKISFLELQTWDFEFINQEKKEFYYVCFECFDAHTNEQIEKDTDADLRKQRSLLFHKLVQEGEPCPSCGEALTIGHICNHD